MTIEGHDTHDDAAGRRDALIALHHLAGGFGDADPTRIPNFRATSPSIAMQTVSDAAERDVPMSARLHLLHRLARRGVPDDPGVAKDYRTLATSVAKARGVDPDQLVADLTSTARDGTPFRTTASAKALPHRDTAFIDEDVCKIRKVDVGGLQATWIFSEFETDAPFEHVAGWVDPRNWPDRGSMLFKQMKPVDGTKLVDLGKPGDEHWHGMFHEEVQLVQRVNTLLHCNYWRDGGKAAGMTYELSFSMDNQIDVDRGFLLVNDTGGVRRVKALKIVGFTDNVWDDVAALVCPFWTDFVRGAVEEGTTSNPVPVPADGTSAANPLADNIETWLQFFGDSARTYLDLMTGAASKAASGSYSTADWLADGTSTWSQLAKDWARAWTYGAEAAQEVAELGLDAGLTPPGQPAAGARGMATAMAKGAGIGQLRPEGTTTPLPNLPKDSTPVCTPLVSIEAGGAVIPAEALSVSKAELSGGAPGVLVRSKDPTVPAGLYVGALKDSAGSVLAPVQLYISRAQGAAGS